MINVLAVGDSMTTIIGNPYFNGTLAIHGYIDAMNAAGFEDDYTLLNVAGFPGERSDQLLTRLPNILMNNPTAHEVVVFIGANNILQGFLVEDYINDLNEIRLLIESYEMTMVLVPAVSVGDTVANRLLMKQYLAYAMQWTSENAVHIAPTWLMLDPDIGGVEDTTRPEYRGWAGFFNKTDLIHYDPPGKLYQGEVIALRHWLDSNEYGFWYSPSWEYGLITGGTGVISNGKLSLPTNAQYATVPIWVDDNTPPARLLVELETGTVSIEYRASPDYFERDTSTGLLPYQPYTGPIQTTGLVQFRLTVTEYTVIETLATVWSDEPIEMITHTRTALTGSASHHTGLSATHKTRTTLQGAL
jgi:hypothetical protein